MMFRQAAENRVHFRYDPSETTETTDSMSLWQHFHPRMALANARVTQNTPVYFGKHVSSAVLS